MPTWVWAAGGIAFFLTAQHFGWAGTHDAVLAGGGFIFSRRAPEYGLSKEAHDRYRRLLQAAIRGELTTSELYALREEILSWGLRDARKGRSIETELCDLLRISQDWLAASIISVFHRAVPAISKRLADQVFHIAMENPATWRFMMDWILWDQKQTKNIFEHRHLRAVLMHGHPSQVMQAINLLVKFEPQTRLGRVLRRLISTPQLFPELERRHPLAALLFGYALRPLAKKASPTEIRRQLQWLSQEAIPALTPILPGWFQALPCGDDVAAAALISLTPNDEIQEKEYLEMAELLGRASERARNLLVGVSLGVHLRTGYDPDIDALDLKLFNAVFPQMAREGGSTKKRLSQKQIELHRQRDRAVRQALYFQQAPDLAAYLTRAHTKLLQLFLQSLTRRHSRRWLLKPSRSSLFYSSLTPGLDDPEPLARYNAEHGSAISFMEVVTGDRRGERYRRAGMSYREVESIRPALEWIRKIVDGALPLVAIVALGLALRDLEKPLNSLVAANPVPLSTSA